MLVLSRKKDEVIVINDNIKITIVEFRGNKVRVGIEAPGDVRIMRSELLPEDHPANSKDTEVDLGGSD